MNTLIRCFLLVASVTIGCDAGAQTKKVFVLGSQPSFRDTLSVTVDRYVEGHVEEGSSLPLALNEFAAIFVDCRFIELTDADELRLVAYLDQGGSVFLNGIPGQAGILMASMGITNFVSLTMAMHSESMSGVTGQYTEGFFRPTPIADPLTLDVGGLDRARGVTPVLVLAGIDESEAAWISSDPATKIVLFIPPFAYKSEPFIALTMCKYFELCILDVEQKAGETLTLAFDPQTMELRLPSSGLVKVYDILGRVVITQYVHETHFPMPHSLAKGTYIARWQFAAAQASTKISVF